ncbi:Uncharacterized protein Adt_26331 [Abeliophyllum distichum]|uniref:Uncharacterized protein n=1 Tax=Abeliophyllum distichum TaxID=126358 RepID=A0ABD1RSH3_9LAMI
MHRTTINDARAQILYHLTHGRKIDLRSYIYTQMCTLGFQTDKKNTTIFISLISGICKEARVQISVVEPVMKAKGPINLCALKNARRHTTQVVEAAPAAEE